MTAESRLASGRVFRRSEPFATTRAEHFLEPEAPNLLQIDDSAAFRA